MYQRRAGLMSRPSRLESIGEQVNRVMGRQKELQPFRAWFLFPFPLLPSFPFLLKDLPYHKNRKALRQH